MHVKDNKLSAARLFLKCYSDQWTEDVGKQSMQIFHMGERRHTEIALRPPRFCSTRRLKLGARAKVVAQML